MLLLLALSCTPTGPGDTGVGGHQSHADGGLADGGSSDGDPTDDGGSAPDGGGTDGGGTDGGGSPDGGAEARVVDRLVIMGDSWSTGSVLPTQALLTTHGHGDMEMAWETTALAGTLASEWAANEGGKLDALDAALDGGKTGADLVLLYLGGNDFNFALAEGLAWWKSRDDAVDDLLDRIEADLGSVLDHALADRPDLHVVIVGYDYLHFEWIELLYGLGLDADGFLEYNQGWALLEERKKDLALAHERIHYVHNLGILTHALGNPVTPPFSLPLVDYPPGFFDPPAGPPDYAPFPGGARRHDIDPDALPPEILPGPCPGFTDGIHPSDAGWDVIMDNAWEQVLQDLIEG